MAVSPVAGSQYAKLPPSFSKKEAEPVARHHLPNTRVMIAGAGSPAATLMSALRSHAFAAEYGRNGRPVFACKPTLPRCAGANGARGFFQGEKAPLPRPKTWRSPKATGHRFRFLRLSHRFVWAATSRQAERP